MADNPSPDERYVCELCSHSPAEPFGFESRTGFIIFRTVRATPISRMCKHCAQHAGRHHQSRTMAFGWWGVISAVLNPVSIWRNASGLRRAMHMDGPRPTTDAPVADYRTPLPPGRPVHLRLGFWVLPVVIAGLAAFTAYDATQQEPQRFREVDAPLVTSAPSTTAATLADRLELEFEVGGCVRVTSGDFVEPAFCGLISDSTIVAQVSDPADCPLSADWYVEEANFVTGRDRVWCVGE